MTDDAVTAQLARQAQQLDDLEQAVTDLRTAPPPAAGQPPAAQPATVVFRWATLAEFVEPRRRPALRPAPDRQRDVVRLLVGPRQRPGPRRGRLARMGGAAARADIWHCPVAARRRRPPDGPAPRPGPRPVPGLRRRQAPDRAAAARRAAPSCARPVVVTGLGVRRPARATGRRDPGGGSTPRSFRPAPHAATSTLRRCRADSRDRRR